MIRTRRRGSRWLLTAVAPLGAIAATATISSHANAGCLYTVDVEAVALGQGGAFVAAPYTGAAVWYNPAGLATQRGFRAEVEGGFIFSPLQYTPAVMPGDDPQPTVTNLKTSLPTGLAGVSWDFGTKIFAAGLFAYVPSSNHYEYDPEGPQKFSGIGGSYVMAFFHAAAALRVTDTLSLGAALGPTYFHARQENAISAAPANLAPDADLWRVLVDTDVNAPLFLTTNFGVSWRPASSWAIGASVMPPFDVHTSGTVDFTTSNLVHGLTTIQGNGIDVDLKMPAIVRFGVRHDVRKDLSVEVAAVYEGWSRFQSIRLVPNVTVSAPILNVNNMAIPPIDLIKEYRDVMSLRLGAEYEARSWLSVRTGAYYETSGSPPTWFDITAPEADKVGLTVGASVRLGRALSIDAAYAHTFFANVTVDHPSQQIRNVLVPSNTQYVGAGTYQMSMDFVHAGLRLRI
jgi:long-chain fatty acid transport protein